MKIFSPLWHIDQEKEMRQLIDEGFSIIFSSVAAEGLDKGWLGHTITSDDIDELVKLQKKYHINVAGEGGEFESLVLDAPFFSKKVIIDTAKTVEDDAGQSRYVIKQAHLSG